MGRLGDLLSTERDDVTHDVTRSCGKAMDIVVASIECLETVVMLFSVHPNVSNALTPKSKQNRINTNSFAFPSNLANF